MPTFEEAGRTDKNSPPKMEPQTKEFDSRRVDRCRETATGSRTTGQAKPGFPQRSSALREDAQKRIEAIHGTIAFCNQGNISL